MPATKKYELNRDRIGLTEREREVLTLVSKYCTATQITHELGVSRQRTSQLLQALKAKKQVRRGAHGTWLLTRSARERLRKEQANS